MTKITESAIEKCTIERLEKQGYQYIYAPSIAPDLSAPGEAPACAFSHADRRQAGSETPESVVQ